MVYRTLHKLVLAVAGCLFTGAVAADVDPEVRQTLVKNLERAGDDIKIGTVEASPVSGLYKVQMLNGPTVYATQDGQYFIYGDLFKTASNGLTNVSEQERGSERVEALKKMGEDSTITFSPEGKTRAHITVFTDVDCGYCRKLHQEVPALNKMGIEVRYMGFPRQGVGSESYRKLTTAWCADNPQETLTKLKSNEKVPLEVCENNPVEEQYKLGQVLGVNATPAIVTESGELIMGYKPAAQLAQRLGLASQ